LINPAVLDAQLYPVVGPAYPQNTRRAVDLAIAEAMSWLVSEGSLVSAPTI
jgi:hypothetical protein